jgi:hypothetical protein
MYVNEDGPMWILTYWDTFTSVGTSWSTAMCILSRDFEHWSYKIPLTLEKAANYSPISPVLFGSIAVYLYVVNWAFSLEMWYQGKPTAELTVPQAEVLRYRIDEAPESGQMWVEIDNRSGEYDRPGELGYYAESLRPLAQVIIDQGLVTSEGAERVESRPMYLWLHSTVRTKGINLVRLYAVDGWQLLRLWRPDCTMEFVDKTLQYCIAEVASRVGNWAVETDGAAEWAQVLNYLTVAASYDDSEGRWFIRSVGRWLQPDRDVVMFGSEMSGLTILHHLLGLVGGVARFGNGDHREVLYCFIPQQQGAVPDQVHTYNDGEILSLQAVQGFAWPTRVLVAGSAGGFEGRDAAGGAVLGMDILQMEYASQWTTADQLETIALGLLDDAGARATGGWMRTRPNVGLELFDVILYSDGKAGGGLWFLPRRVNGLLTEYDPLRHVWEQTVHLEGC